MQFTKLIVQPQIESRTHEIRKPVSSRVPSRSNTMCETWAIFAESCASLSSAAMAKSCTRNNDNRTTTCSFFNAEKRPAYILLTRARRWMKLAGSCEVWEAPTQRKHRVTVQFAFHGTVKDTNNLTTNFK